MKKEEILEKIEKKYQEMWNDYKLANEAVAKSYIDGFMAGLGFCRKLVEKAK